MTRKRMNPVLRVLDVVVGVPLLALFVWPVKTRRRIAGPRDRGPRFGRALLSIVFLVLFYVGVVEVAARAVQFVRGRPGQPSWHYVDDSYLYEFHPFRAYALKPGARLDEGTAGFENLGASYDVGPQRFRGGDLAPPGSGKPRVIACGGSVTFGHGVDTADTWPARLQALAPEWSVANAGVPGYTSQHILNQLQSSLFALEPDLVIVFTGRNDMHMNESFFGEAFRPDYQHIHSVRRNPEGVYKWLVHNSWTVCALARWKGSLGRSYMRMKRRLDDPVPEVGPGGLGAFRRNIDDILMLAARRGIPVLLVSEPPGYLPLRLPDGSENPHLPHLAKDAPGCSPDVYSRGLAAYGEELRGTGAPYVDLVGEFPRDPALFVDSIHLNGAGGEEAARRILPVARKVLAEHAR